MLNRRIRETRIAQGVSQVELAKRLGISKQSLSNWENDNIQPSVEMVNRLADCLCVSTDYLLGRDNIKYIEVTGLTEAETAHIQQIVNDIRNNREKA